MKTEYKKVSVHRLDPGENNENSHEVEEIQNLAKNIEKVGLLNPITVTPVDGGYEIIAGRGRWRAFQELEREEVPAVIIEDVEEPTKSLQRVSENFYRTNLDTYERAKEMAHLSDQGMTYKQLQTHFNLSHNSVGKSVTAGKFLNRKSTVTGFLPDNQEIAVNIIREFKGEKNWYKKARKKLKQAEKDDWVRRDVRVWRDGRKEKEKTQPTEKQKQDREELATKAKETKEKDEKNLVEPDEIEISGKENQLNQKERELDQKDRILEQRQQKHRRERHKVQKKLADSKDNADQLRKDLQELQQEDRVQYIDRSDGLRLVEILGDLVRESENTLNTFKEVFNNA